MAKTAATAIPTFTPEETAKIQVAALSVWDEVAFDLLTAVAEEKRKTVETVTVSRALVIEVSLDAGRIEARLRNDHRTPPEQRAALLERWNALDYKRKIALVKPAFPYGRWGM